MENVVWFKDVDRDDVKHVGGKGANLGELYNSAVPVPNGFIITAQAYYKTVKQSGTLDRIKGTLFNLDVENPTLLETKARQCQKEIFGIKFSKDLENSVKSFYRKLSGKKQAYVAVRSSATAEDLPGASFAGQQATFLNVKGEKELLEAILKCWASLFEPRAIFYRQHMKFDHFKVGIAVPIQLMVASEVSGVMFTVDPVSGNKDVIVIEAIFGLGEFIVGGQITPDHYEVDKSNFKITAKNIVAQDKQLVRAKNQNNTTKQSFSTNKQIAVSRPFQKKQKLSDEKIIQLAKMGAKIEKHYFFPQDIEWAAQDDKLYIVQTRPVTTLNQKSFSKENGTKIKDQNLSSNQLPTTNYKLLLQGAPASPAIATGPVVIIHSPKELGKVQKGNVLVTEMTNPDYVPAMRKAVAIVTNLGGRTSHAAIVSRELGIACVVGTEVATKKLKDGMIVTVDGARGLVYKGAQKISKKDMLRGIQDKENKTHHKTATKLYVNLAEPELAAQIAAKNVDGIGLLRAEFILAQIGTHPKKFLEDKKQDDFIEELAVNLEIFAKSFSTRPVIYRATDLKSNEYRNLKGGDRYEPKEPNPMLGYRGAYRYIKDPDVFKLELEAISRVRSKHPNLHLMIPFVRSVQELESVKNLVGQSGLFKDPKFKFWMMAEIPVNVIMLEDFIKVGIDGVSIGSNDLTMLILGTDRDNEEVATEFYELNPAVLWSLERIIRIASKFNVTCSICGQAPSIYPELTEKLVSWGITSISVNPDVIDATREIIYQAEHKLINK